MNGFAVCSGRYFDRSFAACRTDNADGLGGTVDRIDTQTVRIGKSGFFARNSPHAHTLIDLETARFDNTLFQVPAFKSSALAVDVGVIDVMRADDAQAFGEQLRGKVIGFEQIALYGSVS